MPLFANAFKAVASNTEAFYSYVQPPRLGLSLNQFLDKSKYKGSAEAETFGSSEAPSSIGEELEESASMHVLLPNQILTLLLDSALDTSRRPHRIR